MGREVVEIREIPELILNDAEDIDSLQEKVIVI